MPRSVAPGVSAQQRDNAHKPPIRRFPRPVIYLMAPFVTTLREMLEMRYLWTTPVRLDNSKLIAFLGSEPHTLLDAAVAASL